MNYLKFIKRIVNFQGFEYRTSSSSASSTIPSIAYSVRTEIGTSDFVGLLFNSDNGKN